MNHLFESTGMTIITIGVCGFILLSIAAMCILIFEYIRVHNQHMTMLQSLGFTRVPRKIFRRSLLIGSYLTSSLLLVALFVTVFLMLYPA